MAMEAQAAVAAAPPPQGPTPWYIAAAEVLIKLMKEIGVGGTIIVYACALGTVGAIKAAEFIAPYISRVTTAIELCLATSTENGRKLDKLNEELRDQAERNRDLIREAKSAAERAELAARQGR